MSQSPFASKSLLTNS